MRYDSVFSESEIPFASDKLVLPKSTIVTPLNDLESKSVQSLQWLVSSEGNKTVESVNDVLPYLSPTYLQSTHWYLLPKLRRTLLAMWIAGWNLGSVHGNLEIDKLRKRNSQFESNQYIVNFREPDDNINYTPIRNTRAEAAIRQRVNTLARDVSNSEFDRIKQSLLAAVTPQPETGQPISRTQLLDRINQDLGAKGSRFAGRAETIARTELTFAYNAGRLQSYRDSGLVRAVRFMSIEDLRLCDICRSRNGIVVELDDAATIALLGPPCHPRCRCLWSPILADPEGREMMGDPNRQVENRQILPANPWLVAGIVFAILLPVGVGVGLSLQSSKI